MSPIPWTSRKHGIWGNVLLRKKIPRKRPFSPAQAQYIKKAAKRAVARTSELKFLDTNFNYQQVDRATPGCQSVSSMNQGTTQSTRVGDAITCVTLRCAVNVYFAPGVTNPQHTFRFTVFRWNITDSLLPPGVSQLFQHPGGVGDYLITASDWNWQGLKQKDFDILYDRAFSIGQSGAGLNLRINVPLKNSRCEFDAGSSTGEGKIYICMVADDATGAHTPDLQMQGYFRLLYTDA